MENKINKAVYDFIISNDVDEVEINDIKQNDVKKYIKTDNTIIERLDKIIIDESGRQLLREQY